MRVIPASVTPRNPEGMSPLEDNRSQGHVRAGAVNKALRMRGSHGDCSTQDLTRICVLLAVQPLRWTSFQSETLAVRDICIRCFRLTNCQRFLFFLMFIQEQDKEVDNCLGSKIFIREKYDSIADKRISVSHSS